MQFYERVFYASDWGGENQAYQAALLEFERLRAERGVEISERKDGPNPLLFAPFELGGGLFLMPVRSSGMPNAQTFFMVRAQSPRYPVGRIRVRPATDGER